MNGNDWIGLFPNAFTDSEIGQIPNGWHLKYGEELFTLQKGLSYKGKHLTVDHNDVPMLNLGSFGGDGIYRKEKIKFYNGEFKDKHKIYPNDLLISNTGFEKSKISIGSAFLVPEIINDCEHYIFTHHTTRVIPKDFGSAFNLYLYYLLIQPKFTSRAMSFANGTTAYGLPSECLLTFPILLPPMELLEKFESIVQPIHDRIALADRESEVLAELRDILLPQLVSGELRIPDAEKYIQEAGV